MKAHLYENTIFISNGDVFVDNVVVILHSYLHSELIEKVCLKVDNSLVCFDNDIPGDLHILRLKSRGFLIKYMTF